MTVVNLKNGEKAVIVSHKDGSNEIKSRLFEMGLVPGTWIRKVKETPMNGPIIIKVRDYYVSIRELEAQNIIVNNIPES